MRNSDGRALLGREGESVAEKHLLDRGYVLIERNFRTREGEIDRIFLERDTLVFVEVKTRRSTLFGTPMESITWKKQRKLRQAALAFLQSSAFPAASFRFDVISVFYGSEGGEPLVEHIHSAF
ncbi:MAG: YraN family protein [Clostridia bacterium]